MRQCNDPVEPLTAKDLDEYERIRPQQEQLLGDSLPMTKWANKNFAPYCNSQQLSREDLKGALENKDAPEKDKKILKLVQDNFEKISKDGISLKKEDFESYYASLAAGGLSQLVFRIESLAFHLFTAQMIPVNGKPELEVQGNFVNDKGEKGKEYRRILVSSGADGSTIKELFIQTYNAVDMARYQREYRRAVESIKW